MARPDRSTILKRFENMRAQGIPVIGGGAGVGLSGKAQVLGGVDFLVVYNSGRYRMAGHGSLAGLMPYGNANTVMLDLVEEIVAVADDTPVIAGVCGTDPILSMDRLLDDIEARGCAGVQNFPTVGLIDGNFRQNLEESGMSYTREVDMMAKAHGRGLLTVAYVFNPEEARLMAIAGASVIVVHFGLTSGGAIGAKTVMSLEDTIAVMDACAEAARKINPDVLLLCHGGPVAMPADAEFVIRAAKACDGFLGASSMERLPTEIAITRTAREFKDITLTENEKSKVLP
ncbi:MAG: phosphoenolpyruvate hydrolase family protein [Paracoccaceae bacterium]|nr:phosphoenolpyruvate hydrolase family protein [Paracoccaceae bacterium]